MTISYPLQLPTEPHPTNRTLTMNDASVLASSPFTFKQQSVSFGGDMWGLVIEWPPLTVEQAHPIVAVLSALRGMYGTFVYPATSVPIRGSVNDHAQTPVANGTHASGGRVIRLRGARQNATGLFLAGDIIQVEGNGPRLHQVLTNTDTNASGEAVLDIYPRLRGNLTDGQTIVTARERKGTWRLSSNQRSFSVTALRHYGLTIACTEAL